MRTGLADTVSTFDSMVLHLLKSWLISSVTLPVLLVGSEMSVWHDSPRSVRWLVYFVAGCWDPDDVCSCTAPWAPKVPYRRWPLISRRQNGDFILMASTKLDFSPHQYVTMEAVVKGPDGVAA